MPQRNPIPGIRARLAVALAELEALWQQVESLRDGPKTEELAEAFRRWAAFYDVTMPLQAELTRARMAREWGTANDRDAREFYHEPSLNLKRVPMTIKSGRTTVVRGVRIPVYRRAI